MSEELKGELLPDDFPNFDLSFKIILIGDSGVGKSSISMKASRNTFDEFYTSTVGFEFLTINAKVQDSNIKLQIWDTCGQEVYRSLIISFFRSASLAIIVYAIDNKYSFEGLTQWLNEVQAQSNPDIKLVLIGNKADLEESRKVSKEEGEKFYKDNDMCFFMETSAKTGLNIEKLFIEVAKKLYQVNKNVKTKATRSASIYTMTNYQDTNKATIISTEEEDEIKRKKKKCPC